MHFPHTIEQAASNPSPTFPDARRSSRPIKVVIVGDSHITRSGLRRILESQGVIRVLSEANIKRTSADTILQYSPDVVVIDLDPHAADVSEFIRTLTVAPGDAAILVVADLIDHELVRKALTLGASGIVLKIQPPSVLLAAIEELCPAYHTSSTSATMSGKDRSNEKERRLVKASDEAKDLALINSLTAREREIIWLIGLGLKNKDIANRLSISDITVRHHLTSIFCKLEIDDRQNLLILAHRYGLADLSRSAEPA